MIINEGAWNSEEFIVISHYITSYLAFFLVCLHVIIHNVGLSHSQLLYRASSIMLNGW